MAEQRENLVKSLMNRFNIHSIGTRLITTFVVSVLLTATLITLSSVIIEFNTGRRSILNELQAIANIKENSLKDWTETLEEELETLTNQDVVLTRMRTLLQPTPFRELVSNELRLNFEQTMELTQRFDKLFLLDLQGQVIVSTDTDQEGQRRVEQPYFQKGLEQIFLQPPRAMPATGEIEMFVSRPILHQRGQTLGVLVGQVKPERLAEILAQDDGFNRDSQVYLIDAEGRLITPPFPDSSPGDDVLQSEGAARALDQVNSNGFYTDYRGVFVIGVYRWLPALEVALLSEEDFAQAFQPILATLGTNILVAIGVAGGAVWFGWVITRSIADPLDRLAETSTRIAAGELDLSAEITRRDEIGKVARAFNQMTIHLQELIETLEERVRQRTRALETAADISLELTSILDTNQLLRAIVDRLQTEFDFYHIHIYLREPDSTDLVMAQGTGEVGRQLKAQGHQLKMGEGIVGTVAETNKPFISNNVDKSPNFVRNPLLLDTRSELAVPLRKGNLVVGVLDIQSNQPDRFTPEDLSLMQSVANQTATALDNARLLAETHAVLAELERLNQRITRDRWEQFKKEVPIQGYRFQGESRKIIPDDKAWLSPMAQAATRKQLVTQTHGDNGERPKSELAVPLVLRGEVIGVLGVKREERPEWAEEEVSAVETVANQIALALENARLSKEQEKTIFQLQEVDRLKSEFLTSMSHELRTPLNSIIGFADVLLQGIDGELNELALNDIQLIYNSGQHLLALINDILDLSKIEAGRMELVREPLPIEGLINETLAATSSLLKEKPIQVAVDVDEDLPPVYADKLRLNQILLNLVSNAAKFTEDGQITIKARIAETEPDKMFVSISDTGIGIPEDKFKAIFDRFSQADNSTTRRYGGTGLGLPICQQLVEMHGGQIGMTSEVNVGSTFYFTIPLAPEGVMVTAN